MGFNLFGEVTTGDIKVGYISTDRGYVQGVTICEANSYAQLNPGTTFIIKNRKKIEYKNINEVNQLKPVDVFVPAPGQGKDLPEDAEDRCAGIQLDKKCGPPKVEFYGGGGVGVKGNPVIGKDGSVLAVHVVSGGHGYQYPPLVNVKDGCANKGGGAVARSVLGETSIQTEVYSAEEEFEEYFPNTGSTVGANVEGFSIKEFCESVGKNDKVGFGRRYSPDGKDLGPWDPSMYITDEEDPIARQIADFQEYLAALTDPWWFTRKEAPLQVTSDNEEGFVKRQKKLNVNPNRSVYPVHHWHWGGSLLTHGKTKDIPGEVTYREEIFDIYTDGGHGRGLQFTFTEIGGDSVFVIKADDYTDGGEPRSITKQIKPNVDYKVTSQGAHGIRNVETGTEQGLLRKSFGSRGKEKGLGTSSSIFADLIGTNNDNDDLQILAKKGKFKSSNKTKRDGHSNYDLTYRLTVPSTKGTVSSSQDATTRDVVDIARSFMNDHAISPVPMSNVPGSDFAGMLFTMEWEEEFPYPGEYTFKAQCDNEASFYLDGQQEIPKIAYYKNKPSVLKKNLDWEDSDKKGKVYKMRIDLLNRLQYTDVVVQAPDLSTSATDLRGMIKDWYSIRWSGKVASEQEVDDWIGTGKSADDIRKGILGHQAKSAGVSSGIKVQKVFNTVEWMGKANRQLWRTNVYGRGGFVNTAGVCPFDTTKELDTNPYAGTHGIKWSNVNFPIDGNYIIKVAVDDAVTLTFRGSSGETVIRKEGFSTPGDGSTSTGTSTYTRFFKKGIYTLDADLEQIPGGRFGFRKDAKGKRVKDKEVSFKVTSAAWYANKITIPGLFSVSKDYKGSQINQNFMKNVEVGKEYDVILTSAQRGTNFNSNNVRVRVRDGGRRLQMEEARDGDWRDIECTVTEGQFYSVQGNRCKFKLDETIKGINPMVLAVDVEVAYATKTVVSAKSWNENPMGVAFTIKAPVPPTPVEESPKQKGRCPNNPMWTTRFPSVGGTTSTRTGGGASSSGLRGMIKDWYSQRWKGRVASEKEVDDWIGTGKSASDIRIGILGHQAFVAGVTDDGSGSGGSKIVSGGQWYPVRMDDVTAKKHGHKGGWSKFLNRWAVSPILPLPHEGTDHGGTVFSNTWNVDIPYDGYYQIKGEADDIARYYVDGDLKLDLDRRKKTVKGRDKTSGTSKFLLRAGLRKLRVEVENYTTVVYKEISKKVFSARDWRRTPPTAPPPSNQGGIVCHAGGGKGGTDNQEQLVGGKVIVGQGGDGGKGGDDNMYDSHHGGTGGGAGLRSGGNATNPLTHKQIDSMSAGRYKGGPGGFGVNFTGSSVGNMQQTLSGEESSGGDGVAMGGGGGGNCRGGKGGNGGNGGVKITWGLTGKSQEWTSPGVYNVTVPGNIGNATGNAVPVSAKFVYEWSPRAAEMNKDVGVFLEVSGTGTAECTITMDTNDSWTSKGVAIKEMRCGDIVLSRSKGKKSENISGTGTFKAGKRYKVEMIGANHRTARVGDTRVELLDSHGSDTNASLNLSVWNEPKLDGVTIVCIGGGGSGFMDPDGDDQGSGGSGGAYAWVNKDIKSGKRLKIIVGKGGQGKSVKGGEGGGDSYVELIADPPPSNPTKIIEQKKGKISYKGPNLFHYTDKRWGKVMNKFGVSPANVDANLDKPTPDNVGTKVLEWKNIDFPLKGQYDVLFAADNTASLYINGEQLLYAKDNYTLSSDKSYDKINIGTPGRYDIKIELNNAYHGHSETRTHIGDDVFRSNPSGVVLEIRKDVNVAVDKGKSWTENPMGVAGVLIPPPCPKEVGGRGVVTDVVIEDPGGGFDQPPEEPGDPSYPVVMQLTGIRVTGDPINYNCGVDKIRMVPDLGYKFQPVCGPFGKIEKVTIIPPPGGPPGGPSITTTIDFYIETETGINLQLIPILTPVVVPPDVLPPEDIIQVTDLAGIKQTGYYNGKPYYGAVFYENGIKYAGWYATAGQPIQIYDTLQESIDATITTPPSAIQRQGSDVTSNDPRLNIPGTPENLT